jgi:hypothetical protein
VSEGVKAALLQSARALLCAPPFHSVIKFWYLNCCLSYTPTNEHFGIVPIEAMRAGVSRVNNAALCEANTKPSNHIPSMRHMHAAQYQRHAPSGPCPRDQLWWTDRERIA